VVTGRFTGPARGTVKLRGKVGGRETARELAVELPGAEAGHDVLATLWARARIEDLMAEDYAGAQHHAMRPDLQEQITRLGLDYRLTTQFTSFVAVEEQMVTSGGKSRRVEVPVNMPEGMSHAGVFGTARGTPGVMGGVVGGVPGGIAGGTPGGVIGGIIGSVPSASPVPPPPPPSSAVRVIPRQFDSGKLSAPRIVAEAELSAADIRKLSKELAALAKSANRTLRVDVQVLLSDTSAATIEKLRQLGFVVVRPAGREMLLTGSIEAGRLTELSGVTAVRYVVKRK